MTNLRQGGDEDSVRILVVDDDERNLLALSEVLEPVAEVVCCVSGRDALRELLKGEFAVILLDVFMPDMDGYETAAFIRQREQTGRIPIIFLSAVNKETEHLMRGYEMGAVDYVFKPVDPLVLKSKVGVFVDLFRMRRRLEQSERRQASILRALPMAIYEAIETEGRSSGRQFVGGDLAYFLGDQADAVLKGERDWLDWIHPDDLLRLHDSHHRSADASTVEYRWIGPDGATRYILDQRILTSEKPSPRWAGTLLDVTQQKELQSQLVHVGKLDALGQLTGGVAHDFNNLLAAVLSGINIIERRFELGEKDVVVIDHMRNAAQHGTELVRRMMAFARQQDLSPTSIEPSELCSSVAGLVDHTLGGLVTVTWECPPLGLNIYADRTQLELAMMNLILNARDAMPSGGAIVVSISQIDEQSGGLPKLIIRVADKGCGIPQDLVAKVTEPFFTTKETGKGTGLGLSMVSGFVHQSGGEIRIESAVGEGTAIDMILPATKARETSSEAVKCALTDFMTGRRLLLIDDDDAVRSILSEQFRDAGMIVDAFPRGPEAISELKAKNTNYDFVLCDFAMPEMNGIETLARVFELLPQARCALMTGNVDDSRISVPAAVRLLRKPLTMEAISAAFAERDIKTPTSVPG